MNSPEQSACEEIDVLLVEDDACDAELTLRALRQEGLGDRHLWLRDGAEALDFFFGKSGLVCVPGHSRPKLVLLDLKLPKVDGQEVLRRIKGDPRTRTIPVVVLTSSREVADVSASCEGRANSYIVKPVDFVKFCAAVKQPALFWLHVNEPAEGRPEVPKSLP